MTLTHGALHAAIGRHVIDHGAAPSSGEMWAMQAWDNVTSTCSTMLVFDAPASVDRWCTRHAIPRGDVQPLPTVWAFAQAWYGRHLDHDWTKWTTDEARALFARVGLTGPTWALPATTARF